MGLVGDKIKREEILKSTEKAVAIITYTTKKGKRDFCPAIKSDTAKGLANIFKNNGCINITILTNKTPEFEIAKKKIISRLKKEIAELEEEIG